MVVAVVVVVVVTRLISVVYKASCLLPSIPAHAPLTLLAYTIRATVR